MYLWGVLSAALVLLVSFVPGCQPDDWPYQVALVCAFSAGAAFLIWHARRLGRVIRTTENGLEVSESYGETHRMSWDSIASVANDSRLGYLTIMSSSGSVIVLEHQIKDIHELVGTVLKTTGHTVTER